MAVGSRGQTAPPRAPSAARVPSADEGEPGPVFLVLAYLVVGLLGIVLAVLGVFLLPAGPRVGSTLVLPVGLAIAVVGHPLAELAGLWTTGTRAGMLTPLIGWALVVLPLSSGTAEGDVALPGTTLSVVYLLVAVLAFVAPVFVTRARRGRSVWR